MAAFAALAGLAVISSGCGGGSGGADPVVDRRPPTVVASTPADNATGVATDSVAAADFSAALACSTLTRESFTLADAENSAVEGAVSCAGSRATFTPANALLPETEYVAALTTAVTDSDGNALAARHTWRFTTRERTWGGTTCLETSDAGGGREPVIAVDATGNALAVWTQFDGARTNIWANRYTAGAGWGTAALVESNDVGGVEEAQVAMNARGEAIAVWAQANGTRHDMWANSYAPDTGWATARLIEADDAGSAFNPQVAIDASGNAIAVWRQSDGTHFNIVANRYSAGTWGSAGLIENDDRGDASTPQVTVDQAGNALAVWGHSDGTSSHVRASYYAAGGTWSADIQLDGANDAPVRDAQVPHAALDANGNAMVVWAQRDAGTSNIWARRYSGGAWGDAALIESDDEDDANAPRIAFDAQGNAIAVWQHFKLDTDTVRARRYTASSGWGAEQILFESDYSISAPRLAVNGKGHAMAVWTSHDGTHHDLLASRYTASGWGAAAPIDGLAGDSSEPQVAVDPNGDAIVVWDQTDGDVSRVWAKRLQ